MITTNHIGRTSLLPLLTVSALVLSGCASGQTDEPVSSASAAISTESAAASEAVQKQTRQSAKETLMVYMVGSDLETQGGAATVDLQEMALSGYDEDAMNIVVCAGGASHWWNSSVKTDQLNIYQLKEQDLSRRYKMTSQNMGDAETLTEFLDYSYQNYPAEHYSLIFWNHGGGAVIGYGADELHEHDLLSVSELRSGMEASHLTNETKLEFVGFDACLMGMIEVADAFSDYANYLIASEEVEAADGWDYSCLSDLTKHEAYTGEQSAHCFIQAFSDYYEDYHGYFPDYTLSCVDLSKIDPLVRSLEALAESASNSLKEGHYSQIAKLRDRTKTFGKVSGSGFYDYVDLYSLAEYMQEEFPKEAKALKDACRNAVVENGTNIPYAGGLSVYFPYENKDYVKEWIDAYSENGFSPAYTSFIRSFADTLSGNPISEWDLSELVPEQGASASEYSVQLSKEQLADYAHAASSIWQQDDDDTDTYICWINSGDVDLSRDGRLSTLYDGRIFYLETSEGERLPACATEIERTDGYTKFAIPVIINMMTPDIKNAYIHVKVDQAHPDGVISGIYSTIDTESDLYPDKNLIRIQEGDIIAPFLFARDIVFRDDHTVAPFDEWKVSSGVGRDFKVTGNFTVRLSENDLSGDYAFLFSVTDTQGNQYFTNYLDVSYDRFHHS